VICDDLHAYLARSALDRRIGPNHQGESCVHRSRSGRRHLDHRRSGAAAAPPL